MPDFDSTQVQRDIDRALDEDLSPDRCDITATLLPAGAALSATVISRDDAIIAGRPWFECAMQTLDGDIQIVWHVQDGDSVTAGQQLCHLSGNARNLLAAERCALNFLQLLSGTATTTSQYAQAIAHTDCILLDTRKTLPGLRYAQRYAVRCGGASNHRFGLFDAILIKENHIAAAGSIAAALASATNRYAEDTLIEVEVENLDELEQAVTHGAHRALLDNFSLKMLSQAVSGYKGRIGLEASGNVTLDTIVAIAETGVDFISCGALTKHLHACDLSLRFSENAT